MELTTFISILVAVGSFGFSIAMGLKNSKRTDMNDYKQTFERITRIEARLDELCRKIDTFMTEQGVLERKTEDLTLRVNMLENGNKYTGQLIEDLIARIKALEERK